jgi:ketosteroid isomerase-like protein
VALTRQRQLVRAFLAASCGGDFAALLETLDLTSCCAPTKQRARGYVEGSQGARPRQLRPSPVGLGPRNPS